MLYYLYLQNLEEDDDDTGVGNTDDDDMYTPEKGDIGGQAYDRDVPPTGSNNPDMDDTDKSMYDEDGMPIGYGS